MPRVRDRRPAPPARFVRCLRVSQRLSQRLTGPPASLCIGAKARTRAGAASRVATPTPSNARFVFVRGRGRARGARAFDVPVRQSATSPTRSDGASEQVSIPAGRRPVRVASTRFTMRFTRAAEPATRGVALPAILHTYIRMYRCDANRTPPVAGRATTGPQRRSRSRNRTERTRIPRLASNRRHAGWGSRAPGIYFFCIQQSHPARGSTNDPTNGREKDKQRERLLLLFRSRVLFN